MEGGKEVIFKITGQVREFERKIGVPNLVVRAFDKDLIYDDLLGSTTTDENGCFEIIYEGTDYKELFDKKPDIYLMIKSPDYRRTIHTTRDKVRFEADREEHFVVDIPRKALGDLAPPIPPKKEVKEMKELPERCQEFNDQLLGNKELLQGLSQGVAEVLNKHEVKIAEDETYIFEPHIYVKPKFLPLIFAEPDPEPWNPKPEPADPRVDSSRMFNPINGPIEPGIMEVLERYRVSERVGVGNIREQIVGNKALYRELSQKIAAILKQHDVKLQEDETYLFVAYTFKKPIFAQNVFPRAGSVELFRVADAPRSQPSVVAFNPQPEPPDPSAVRFSPRIFLSDQPLLYWVDWIRPRPLPGLIDWRRPIRGIPAPEILEHLEQLRIG
jgi:hypothetical protein